MILNHHDVEWVICDLDDTLVECVRHYWQQRAKAFELMRNAGIDTTDAQKVMDAIEHDNVRRLGFAKERFPLSLSATYADMCKQQEVELDHHTRFKVEAAGWEVYDIVFPTKPGALEFLHILHRIGVKTILFTKGDPEVQNNRIDKGGFRGYFDHIEVVNAKDVAAFEALIAKYSILPQRAVMIGDSVKGDINPALAVGMQAIYIPCDNAWGYEVEELQPGHVQATDLHHASRLLRGVNE